MHAHLSARNSGGRASCADHYAALPAALSLAEIDAVCYRVCFDAGELVDYEEEAIVDFFRDIFEQERK